MPPVLTVAEALFTPDTMPGPLQVYVTGAEAVLAITCAVVVEQVMVLDTDAVTDGGVPPELTANVAVLLQAPGFTTTVYIPTPETAVAEAVGEEIVEPPGPVHVKVGEPAEVVAVRVVDVAPQASAGADTDTVGVVDVATMLPTTIF